MTNWGTNRYAECRQWKVRPLNFSQIINATDRHFQGKNPMDFTFTQATTAEPGCAILAHICTPGKKDGNKLDLINYFVSLLILESGDSSAVTR